MQEQLTTAVTVATILISVSIASAREFGGAVAPVARERAEIEARQQVEQPALVAPVVVPSDNGASDDSNDDNADDNAGDNSGDNAGNNAGDNSGGNAGAPDQGQNDDDAN